MEFKIVDVFKRSVTIELESDTCFCQEKTYDIRIDDRIITTDKNVVSVTGLLPDHEYEIVVEFDGVKSNRCFRTQAESYLLNVKAFGAKGDGITNDTPAIQAAISACPENGTVLLPAGTYYVTPLFLKSNMTLWLDEGATLLGDNNREHYPIMPGMVRSTDEKDEFNLGTWEGNPLDSFASLITGIDLENVDIVGPGTLDGNAQNADWWVNPKVKRVAWRPNILYLCRCNNVRVQNIKVQNSPAWNVHPYYCDNLAFLNLHIQNPSDSPNTDGLDPESCKDVLVLGTVISVGDDCMAIKSGKYYMSLNHHKATENMVIRNCKFEKGHGSVTVGSEAAGGVKNIRVSQCIFDGTDRGLRIKTRRGRGERSVLDDIVFEKIKMNGVHMPFTVNMFYFCDPDGHSDYVQSQKEAPVDEMTPVIGSIIARDIVCEDVNACVLCAVGLPERPIEKLVLENIKASFLPESEQVPERPVMMDNFQEMKGRSVYAKNVSELVIRNVTIQGASDSEPECIGVAKTDVDGLRYDG
ncbi:glycoside hydrolase family 28 protein [Butyrivibrio proteoclasticus]|uniref:glycoside hydrolase family 28 protein n=1 Tax=Butyrivibrio proteoclasticus TaxID=43305 RepID=UPI00047A7B64|nr:glycoside hydrolase family 28 protein [Butyrivibrio proteoclasticus]